MKVTRIAAGSYEVHTASGVYGLENCPAEIPRATGLPAGPRWMLTYPGEYTADAEFRTKRGALASIRACEESKR
ncbi:hypothetical protein ACFW1M_11715 [Streptomyces inhibens]|uniref:hypothetical protein n=1 Tax=Streptomyces inhibens TaxID=2293571 RepID=UPI00368ADA44